MSPEFTRTCNEGSYDIMCLYPAKVDHMQCGSGDDFN